MNITQLVDCFGSNRMNAREPAKFLDGCRCIAVPFAGGLSEVLHFKANVILVNDLDRHVMNCATIVRDRPQALIGLCDKTLFHPDELANAQDFCRLVEPSPKHPPETLLRWAHAYYVCAWMTRGGKMGSRGEFEQGLSTRWKAGGGDSVVRFRNATEGIAEWSQAVRNCTFTTLDCFDFLAQCKKRDIPENGIYADAPWPDDGDKYVHKFPEPMQRRLAQVLSSFEKTRVVVRYNNHPLIRELYQESLWDWHYLEGRTQANNPKAEVLLVNKIRK